MGLFLALLLGVNSKREKDWMELVRVVKLAVLRVSILTLSLQCLNAATLSGTVLNQAFRPLSGAHLRLFYEGQRAAAGSVTTDETGTFVFPEVKPGEYAVFVDFYPFVSVQVHHILLSEGENRRLRRILLDAGEGAGNCVVRLSASSTVQHTGGMDVQISGRVLIGRNEKAAVTLVVFGEKDATTRSLVTETGGFQFVIPGAGDVRLEVELRNRSGRAVMASQQLDMQWADLGDRISIPKIKLNRQGLGHFCY